MAGEDIVLAEGRDVDPSALTVSTVGQRVQITVECGDITLHMDAPPGIVRHWALDFLTAAAAAEASQR